MRVGWGPCERKRLEHFHDITGNLRTSEPMPHWTESTSTAVIFAFPVTDPPAQRQVPIMTRSLVNLASVGSVHHFSIRIADE